MCVGFLPLCLLGRRHATTEAPEQSEVVLSSWSAGVVQGPDWEAWPTASDPDRGCLVRGLG